MSVLDDKDWVCRCSLQLESTANDMQSQARMTTHDLNYYQSKAEELEKQNLLLNSKLVGEHYVLCCLLPWPLLLDWLPATVQYWLLVCCIYHGDQITLLKELLGLVFDM